MSDSDLLSMLRTVALLGAAWEAQGQWSNKDLDKLLLQVVEDFKKKCDLE